jgi:hypothetical protein
MRTYHFTCWLSDDPREFEVWADALYEAGGDDSSPGVQTGKPYVSFHREANGLETALRTAAVTVHAAGLSILRVEIDAEELAELIAAA